MNNIVDGENFENYSASLRHISYRITLRTRMVAGDPTISFFVSCFTSVGGSSRGLLDADVAIANAAAAVDVLLLNGNINTKYSN